MSESPEKLLKDVLITLTKAGRTDRVLIIDNIPESLFYELRFPLICVGQGANQNWQPDLKAGKEMKLFEELRLSQTGNGSIVFDMDNEQSLMRWGAVYSYIRNTYPHSKVLPQAVENSVDPKNLAAGPLALKDVPRVVLPVLSPSDLNRPVADGTPESLRIAEIKKQAVDEYKAAEEAKIKERMAKVRAAKEPTNE